MMQRAWLSILLVACGDDAVRHERDVIETTETDTVSSELEPPDSNLEAEVELVEEIAAETHAELAEDAAPEIALMVTRQVRGALTREDRAVDATRNELLPIAVVPVAGLELGLWSGDARLASTTTDAVGAFAIEVTTPAGVALELRWEAVEEGLALLDSEGVGVPSREGIPVRATRAWAWQATVDDDDLGTLLIDEADGAGAFAIFEHARAVRSRVEDLFGVERLPSLAILWSPMRTPPCLSCYLPAGWGPTLWSTTTGELVFDRAIFLSGAPAAPHHFTPSLLLHELGHWVMDSYSRLPVVNGGHGWGDRLAPPLAWSEGFATFFAQWFLSREVVDSRFFTVQADIAYWIDLEAVGGPDATSIDLSFPLPTEGGGMTQLINEAVVAAILWDLWDPANDDEVALGDAVVVAIAAMGDRGVAGPDLVDLLDAAACLGELGESGAWASALAGFPWDASPACP